MKTEYTETPGRQRAKPSKIKARYRSKPDTVDRPVRTAQHHYNSTQYCSTERVFIYITLPADQHHISDVAKWRQGGSVHQSINRLYLQCQMSQSHKFYLDINTIMIYTRICKHFQIKKKQNI